MDYIDEDVLKQYRSADEYYMASVEHRWNRGMRETELKRYRWHKDNGDSILRDRIENSGYSFRELRVRYYLIAIKMNLSGNQDIHMTEFTGDRERIAISEYQDSDVCKFKAYEYGTEGDMASMLTIESDMCRKIGDIAARHSLSSQKEVWSAEDLRSYQAKLWKAAKKANRDEYGMRYDKHGGLIT